MSAGGRPRTAAPARYVHPLSFRWLTPLYDPVVRLTTRELEFKRRLVLEANLSGGERALDLGSGTGTLALMLKRAALGATVVGVDGDADVVAVAVQKARSQELDVAFEVGLAGALQFEPASFDVVVSSLVFHHLAPESKRRALAEILRLLKPGGFFLLADFGGVPAWMARSVLLPLRVFDGLATTADNFYGRLPDLMRAAGFREVERVARYITPVGPVEITRAVARTAGAPVA